MEHSRKRPIGRTPDTKRESTTSDRRGFVIALGVTGISGWGLYALGAAGSLLCYDRDKAFAVEVWKTLGAGPDTRIICASSYRHYPAANNLAGKSVRHRSLAQCADEITHFGQVACFNPEVVSATNILENSAANYLDENARDYCASSKAMIRDRSIIVVGSPKVNPVADWCVGYQSQRNYAERRDFISPDGSWKARGLFKLYSDESDPLMSYSSDVGENWNSWKCKIWCEGGEIFEPQFAGNPAMQVGCHFLITKLESPAPEPFKQNVVMISSAHSYAVNAVLELFSFPLSASAKRFWTSVINGVDDSSNWQVVGRVTGFNQSSHSCHVIEAARFNTNIAAYSA